MLLEQRHRGQLRETHSPINKRGQRSSQWQPIGRNLLHVATRVYKFVTVQLAGLGWQSRAVDSQWAVCIACFVACRSQAVGPGPCTGPIAVRRPSCSIRECSFLLVKPNLVPWRSLSCHVLDVMTSALRSGRLGSSDSGRSEASRAQKLPFGSALGHVQRACSLRMRHIKGPGATDLPYVSHDRHMMESLRQTRYHYSRPACRECYLQATAMCLGLPVTAARKTHVSFRRNMFAVEFRSLVHGLGISSLILQYTSTRLLYDMYRQSA